MSSPDFSASDQQAYMDFMLHGRRRQREDDSTRSTPSTPTHPSATTATAGGRTNSHTPRSSSSKRAQNILQAFRKTLEQDWWETDNLLGQIVSSIADLRLRISLIQSSIEERRSDADTDAWKLSFQHTKNRNNHLLDQDLELALHHSIRKHEKAMQNLRQMLAALGQNQEALGRRLEEVMNEDLTIITTMNDAVVASTKCSHIYKVAALDLYNKQMWGQEILQDFGNKGVQLAEKIASQWPRSSFHSPWRKLHEKDFPWAGSY